LNIYTSLPFFWSKYQEGIRSGQPVCDIVGLADKRHAHVDMSVTWGLVFFFLW